MLVPWNWLECSGFWKNSSSLFKAIWKGNFLKLFLFPWFSQNSPILSSIENNGSSLKEVLIPEWSCMTDFPTSDQVFFFLLCIYIYIYMYGVLSSRCFFFHENSVLYIRNTLGIFVFQDSILVWHFFDHYHT